MLIIEFEYFWEQLDFLKEIEHLGIFSDECDSLKLGITYTWFLGNFKQEFVEIKVVE